MARADWTYELPPVTGDSVWLEEYLVYDRDGVPAGKVFAVLEHDGERLLGIEREHLPLRHDRRVVPFSAIEDVDHEHLGVHLRIAHAELDDALQLDPGRGVEQGGEARRVVDPPAEELPGAADVGVPGPVDRPAIVAAPLVAMAGLLALLAVFVFWGISRSSAAFPYFAVPGVLFAVSGFVGYRAWARPWRRDAASRRNLPPRRPRPPG